MRWVCSMWDDVRGAFSFLTLLPLGYADGRKAGWSFAWFPLVGLAIGAFLIGIASLSPYNRHLTSLLILLAWVVVTGGLHLDGFGDSCDGLLATVSPERRLKIMKDPRTGTWAVVGIVLLLLAKWVLIQQVDYALLLIPPVLGRLAMVYAAYAFPYARKSGMGAFFRDGLGRRQVVIATGIAFVITMGFGEAQLMVTAFCVMWLVGKWASIRLGGGITGDVYGAICELVEVVCLLALV